MRAGNRAVKQKKTNQPGNQDQGNFKKLARVIGMAVLIVLLLAAVAFFLNQHINLFGESEKKEESSRAVFYQTGTDNVKSLKAYDNGTAVLNNSALNYYDSACREISSNKHFYASPEMKISGKTTFLYDKGGTGYRIEKNASVYSEKTAPGIITCGALGKKDNYAFSVNNHDGFQSHIFVYSLKGKKQFEWGSASDYCLAMALSDSGNKLAVCVVGVENAEYYSKVMLFSFNSGSPSYTVDFSGKTVYELDFISSRKIAAFTDGGVYIIDGDGNAEAVQTFTSSEIEHSFVCPTGLRCTVVAPFGNSQAPLLTVFDERNRILFSRSYTQEISGVVCNDGNVAVIMNDSIELLNRENKVIGEIVPGETCEQFALVNHSLYLRTGTGIHKYNIYADSEKSDGTDSASVPVTKPSKSSETTSAATTLPEPETTEPFETDVTEDEQPDDEQEDESPAYDEEDEDYEEDYEDEDEDEEDTEEALFG